MLLRHRQAVGMRLRVRVVREARLRALVVKLGKEVREEPRAHGRRARVAHGYFALRALASLGDVLTVSDASAVVALLLPLIRHWAPQAVSGPPRPGIKVRRTLLSQDLAQQNHQLFESYQ